MAPLPRRTTDPTDTRVIPAALSSLSLPILTQKSGMGRSAGTLERQFDEAIGKFALAYADQAERDHAALKTAVRAGIIDVQLERWAPAGLQSVGAFAPLVAGRIIFLNWKPKSASWWPSSAASIAALDILAYYLL